MPTIKFQTNVPVELRLRSTEGKPVESQFGGMQHMFSAEEGAFYVSETVGQIIANKLRELHVRAGDLIEITKAEVASNGRKRIEWQVAMVGYTSDAPDNPSELEETLARSIAQVEARKQAAKAPAAMPSWAEALVSQSCVLVDAYAAVVKHSAQYQGLVKSDDARSIMLSAFINLTKQGGRSAA